MAPDNDDDTQVYADTLLLVYQRGFADGKKAALAQEQALKKLARLGQEIEQQAEPVALKCGAIIEVFAKDWRMEYLSLPVGKHKLYTQQYIYTAPPQRQWVGLTDEDFLEACQIAERGNYLLALQRIQIKLKERNT